MRLFHYNLLILVDYNLITLSDDGVMACQFCTIKLNVRDLSY